ncbi:DUF488 domain-containing protein [Desertivirga xinjiangensis]|uniref:DUF488 domain-containing protein n=1 Tax=Desertivirga xinjiangensis TaxID=539206 RepID=UPI00210D7F73|nr:DUF488 domain-containing protein [Pedobacter xinjiangensis]
MFYRRKIILALLEVFDGKLEKLRLQKLLFLLSKRQLKPDYEFVPYKYGCYSFSASADLTTMVAKGLLSDSSAGWVKSDPLSYIKGLKESDRKLVQEIKKLYGNLDGNELMKHTYINFPFYAINSIKASELLAEEQLNKIKQLKTHVGKNALFTIGYEGISLEEYLNKLVKNNVELLVDVRKNPLSMKYGFSKSLLKKFCENLGIKYIHFPEVGIASDKRQELNDQSDYDELFKIYKIDTLANTHEAQIKILQLLKSYKRIALTCFEANICQCHRKPLAESIASLPDFNFELIHI